MTVALVILLGLLLGLLAGLAMNEAIDLMHASRKGHQ